MDELTAKIETIRDALLTLMGVIGSASLVLLLLFIVLKPWLPEFANENRGMFMKVLLAMAAGSLVVGLVTFVTGG